MAMMIASLVVMLPPNTAFRRTGLFLRITDGGCNENRKSCHDVTAATIRDPDNATVTTITDHTELMVGRVGVEPTTIGLKVRCSTD